MTILQEANKALSILLECTEMLEDDNKISPDAGQKILDAIKIIESELDKIN